MSEMVRGFVWAKLLEGKAGSLPTFPIQILLVFQRIKLLPKGLQGMENMKKAMMIHFCVKISSSHTLFGVNWYGNYGTFGIKLTFQGARQKLEE